MKIQIQDTDIERTELGVGILVADAPLEGAHGIFRGDSLGAYDIGNLEVQGDVFASGS